MMTKTRLLTAVLLAVTGSTYYYFFWGPLSRRHDEAVFKWDAVEAKIGKAKQQCARLPRLQQEIMRLATMAAEDERRLPGTRPTAGAIDGFEELARKDNVAISEMIIGASASKVYFTEISYEVTALATSSDMEKFLNTLAHEERVVHATKLTLGPPGSNGKRRAAFKLLYYQYRR